MTTRWQTVSDLASVVQPAELAWSIREAMFHEPISTRELIQIRDARFQRTGAPCIRDAVSLYLVGSCGADSYPEMLAIEYLTASGLQPTCINVPLQTSAGTVRPDLAWPEFGLAFELDGRQHDRHPDRRDDARRTELLRDAGYDLVRARAKDVLRDINSALRPLVDELISRRESGYVSRTGSG
ncbi:MAG: hypothetical protein JWM86_2110 [Thermoleophilia bacterium]|nr:hypothetical protein [Thermoleophilia bacterium]